MYIYIFFFSYTPVYCSPHQLYKAVVAQLCEGWVRKRRVKGLYENVRWEEEKRKKRKVTPPLSVTEEVHLFYILCVLGAQIKSTDCFPCFTHTVTPALL